MDFKRIECIFLLVFVAINIFLFVEIFQAPKLLNGVHTVNVQNNDLKNEIIADNITLPKISDEQGEGYYLATKEGHSWISKAKEQLSNNCTIVSSKDTDAIIVNLNKPVDLGNNKNKTLSNIKSFVLNTRNVYQGGKYKYIDSTADKSTYIFAQKSKYGLVTENHSQLSIVVKNNHIVSYMQYYVAPLNTLREKQATISSQAAIDALYTYSELPNNSHVLWISFVYSKLITTRGSIIFIPTWLVAIQNSNNKFTIFKRVNAFSGNVMTIDNEEDKVYIK